MPLHPSTKIFVGMYTLYGLYAGCILSAQVEVENFHTGNGISYTGRRGAFSLHDMSIGKVHAEYNRSEIIRNSLRAPKKSKSYGYKIVRAPKKSKKSKLSAEEYIRKLTPEQIQGLSEKELKALTKSKHFDQVSLDQIVISRNDKQRVDKCFQDFQALTRVHFAVPENGLAQKGHEDYVRPRRQLIEAAFKLVCRDAPK
jgi:hypothetical protein